MEAFADFVNKEMQALRSKADMISKSSETKAHDHERKTRTRIQDLEAGHPIHAAPLTSPQARVAGLTAENSELKAGLATLQGQMKSLVAFVHRSASADTSGVALRRAGSQPLSDVSNRSRESKACDVLDVTVVAASHDAPAALDETFDPVSALSATFEVELSAASSDTPTFQVQIKRRPDGFGVQLEI